MNLDDLVNSILEEEQRMKLAHRVTEWKEDETDIYGLYEMICKWHGKVSIEGEVAQDNFYSNLQSFKSNAIDNIGGMTVNERLYWFGLFEEWDQSELIEQQRIRGKLHASA
jgi:hypothetical protein